MKKLLFLGEVYPNTIHGVAVCNTYNLSILSKYFDLKVIEENNSGYLLKRWPFLRMISFGFLLSRYYFYLLFNRVDHIYLIYANSLVGSFKNTFSVVGARVFSPKAKLVFHLHRGDLNKVNSQSKLMSRLFTFSVKRSHKFIILSKVFVPSVNGDLKNKFAIIPNTVDYSQPGFDRQFDGGTRKLLYISNYIVGKGILDLLEAAAQLNDSCFTLDCFGESTEPKTKKLAQEKSAPHITVNGPVLGDSKYQEYENHDCLVLPSHNEGQPLVILEAMMMGLPVVASDVGDVRGMLGDDYPFMYDPSLEGALTSCLKEFLSTPLEELILLAGKLHQRYAQLFSQNSHQSKLREVFAE